MKQINGIKIRELKGNKKKLPPRALKVMEWLQKAPDDEVFPMYSLAIPLNMSYDALKDAIRYPEFKSHKVVVEGVLYLGNTNAVKQAKKDSTI